MPADSPSAFLRRLVRGRKRRREIELADMGTAFALDQSFDEGWSMAEAVKAPAPARGPVPGWRFWLGRKPGA